jgi:hypothetical protein
MTSCTTHGPSTKLTWIYVDYNASTGGADGIAALKIIMPASKPLSCRMGDNTSMSFLEGRLFLTTC